MAIRVLALVLFGGLLVCGNVPAANDQKFERDFSERLSSVTIENPDGVTEAETWSQTTVRVVASRMDTGLPIGSDISFETPSQENLRIRIRSREDWNPIKLTVYVPASIRLRVKSAQGRVTVRGSVAALSIDTDSGAVFLYLPEDSNLNLSLRSIDGDVESKIPFKVFGKAGSHVLDAQAGQGGSPVIARSQRGNISVLPHNFGSSALGRATDRHEKNHGVEGPNTMPIRSEVEPESFRGDETRAGETLLKLEARLVNLNVKVTDAGGKTLPALRKEDFIIYEDDVRQDVAYFEPVTAPLNIVLLLDLSGSTEHKIKVMKKAAQKFVDSLKPTDRIAVAGFTRRFFIISNFTTDHKLLKDRIGDIKNRHSGTAYYDAMWATLDLLDEAKATRKSIVVLTDGVDNSLDHPDDSEFDPKHRFDELLARIEEADATIYPIYLDTEYETIGQGGRNGHVAYITARKQLETIAEQTGALMFKAERAEDLEGVYQQVAAELHSLYSMAYTPSMVRTDGKWRKIGIAVNLPGARVRTKKGYYAK